MTSEELDRIERELDLKLPSAYRKLSIEFPFKPVANDWVYWFYDSPERVIEATLAPQSDGSYDMSSWRKEYVVIGQSASGDLYFLDSTGSTVVYVLTHDSYEIFEEWPDLQAFSDDWLRFPEEAAAQSAAREAELKARWQRAWRIMGVITLLVIVHPALLLIAIGSRK